MHWMLAYLHGRVLKLQHAKLEVAHHPRGAAMLPLAESARVEVLVCSGVNASRASQGSNSPVQTPFDPGKVSLRWQASNPACAGLRYVVPASLVRISPNVLLKMALSWAARLQAG